MDQLDWLQEAFEIAYNVTDKRMRTLGTKTSEAKLQFWTDAIHALRRPRRLRAHEEATVVAVTEVLASAQSLTYADAAFILFLLATASLSVGDSSVKGGQDYVAAATKD